MNEPVAMIGLAFVLGYLGRLVGLPPLVGFLAAGFVLRAAWGVEATETITNVADLGVTLMLFTIGLKLKFRDLAKPPVWAGSSLHFVFAVGFFLPVLMLGGVLGLPLVGNLTWHAAGVIAFALAFSSTVFAVVVFQAKGEIDAPHAKAAIGILVVQDIFAVVFLTLSKGEVPTWPAIPLVASLFLLRPALRWVLARSGHGELLVLVGLLLPLGVWEAFELVNLKGDLGALLVGVLLASSPKADELARLLFGFKELFLVTFFLSIGLVGDPTPDVLLVAGALVVLMPVKSALFFLVLTRLRMRARGATFVTLGLSNYSEFGLIVGSVAAKSGLVDGQWLLVFAFALSATYVIAAPATSRSERIFERLATVLRGFETKHRLPEDEIVDVRDTEILIAGMGRMGRICYDELAETPCGRLLGIDYDPEVIARNQDAGRNVVKGDATDCELWQRLDPSTLEAVVLCMPSHQTQLEATRQLRTAGYRGLIGATTRFHDEATELTEAGADEVCALASEAGVSFAQRVAERMADGPKLAADHAPGAA